MEVYFNKLANVLPANDKRENVIFLLSEKIANCSNSLSNDSFFILKDEINNVYVDKNFLTEIKNELTDVINEYIKDNPHYLNKINKANNECGNVFLYRKNINCLTVKNLSSLDTAKKIIEAIIIETNSSSLKEKLFNKDNNPAVNLFFEKKPFHKFKIKSIGDLIKKIENKTIGLNPGCDLPFIIGKKEYMFVKLGNIEAANNQVKLENEDNDDNNIETNFNKLLNKENIKIKFTKFEILFNFFNENIDKLYDVINIYYKCVSLNNANSTFNFIKDDGSLESFYKIINEKDDGEYIRKYLNYYNEFNEAHKALNIFHQDCLNLFKEGNLEKIDINKLVEMTKKVESNTDSISIELKSLEHFYNECEEYENKIMDAASSFIKKGKNPSCSLMTLIKLKTDKCEDLLKSFIRREETGFLSRVYKFFFPKKHNDSIKLLNKNLDKVREILIYINLYDADSSHSFLKNNIINIITTTLSEIEIPRTLLNYLYGENKKWDNFKRSLFN
ncbi:hypothetical protein I6G31_12890 [Proteus penneri]|uniref:hypothetical protein n=1 Tax=Proteus TaxID=583 RepID=UPI000D6E365E|nr:MULTISPECIES: hypothetical protein [Proteus]NBM95507.1 hypothetical protein [Proteus sp. G2660]QPT32998.1 hypothetical protein I6G31_12890 [Proteus penneri]